MFVARKLRFLRTYKLLRRAYDEAIRWDMNAPLPWPFHGSKRRAERGA